MAWRLTALSARMTGSGLRAAGRLVRQSHNAYSRAQINREIARSQAAMGVGVLAPGDPPPVPGLTGTISPAGLA